MTPLRGLGAPCGFRRHPGQGATWDGWTNHGNLSLAALRHDRVPKAPWAQRWPDQWSTHSANLHRTRVSSRRCDQGDIVSWTISDPTRARRPSVRALSGQAGDQALFLPQVTSGPELKLSRIALRKAQNTGLPPKAAKRTLTGQSMNALVRTFLPTRPIKPKRRQLLRPTAGYGSELRIHPALGDPDGRKQNVHP